MFSLTLPQLQPDSKKKDCFPETASLAMLVDWTEIHLLRNIFVVRHRWPFVMIVQQFINKYKYMRLCLAPKCIKRGQTDIKCLRNRFSQFFVKL